MKPVPPHIRQSIRKGLNDQEALNALQEQGLKKHISSLLFNIWSLSWGLGYLVLWPLTPLPLYPRLMRGYLKRYFKRFFHYQGLISYNIDDLPEHLDEPTLILATRMHAFSSLFIFQHCPFPIVVPVLPFSQKLRAIPFINWQKIADLLNLVSYPDHCIEHNLDRITALLDAGHHVLVFINDDIASAPDTDPLSFSPGLQTLLNRQYPSYLLRTKDLNLLSYSNYFNPKLIGTRFTKRSPKSKKDSDILLFSR